MHAILYSKYIRALYVRCSAECTIHSSGVHNSCSSVRGVHKSGVHISSLPEQRLRGLTFFFTGDFVVEFVTHLSGGAVDLAMRVFLFQRASFITTSCYLDSINALHNGGMQYTPRQRRGK